MSKLMKGLTQFIMDLRNSRDIEEENKRINLEINNITSKFQDNGGSGLSGYQKKKYICKLVYIYLLGHENHSNLLDGKFASEPLKLIASNVYSEKQIGYLALLVLYKKDSRKSVLENLNDLLELSHASLVKDMHSNNEEFNCLALHFIASNFCFSVNNATAEESGALEVHDGDDSSKEWLELIDLVYSFATSPIANKTIKKKAVLALVVLFKIYPGVIVSNSNWVPRILTILEEVEDLGLVTATIPLVEFITLLITPQFIKSTMTSISRKLYQIIIEDSCPREYYYYNTPAPWLVVKLLSLIESLFLLVDQKTGNKLIHLQDLDQTTINNLKLCISKSIQNSSQPVKGLPNRNSNSSILFQAVSLVVFLNASAESVKGAINALIVLLDSYETNTRYLALDALIKLIARGSSGEAGLLFFNNEFEKFVPKLFHLLEKDRDISVKRKTLDLLYTICNGSNYIAIINGILEFFTHADFNLKAELAVKIAVLSEKFATELTWYVDTMLNLLNQTNVTLSTGGHLGGEIWERIVQIIVNNDDLQLKLCKKIISLYYNKKNSGGSLSENLVKVGGFILGEYGQLLLDGMDDEKYSIDSQFQLLYDSYFKVSLTTRALLLTCFLKFVVKFPNEDFIPDIIDLFEIETQSIDLEIQTRGFEYLKLCTGTPEGYKGEYIKQVVRSFPVFERKVSPLMSRLGSVHRVAARNRSTSFVNAKKISQTTNNNSTLNAVKGQHKSVSTLSLPVTEEPEGTPTDISSEGDVNVGEEDDDDDDESNPFGELSVILSPNWYNGYHRMLQYDAGIFYEDQFVKLLYKIVKENSQIHYNFTIINNAAKTAGTNLTGFTILDLKSLASKTDPNYLIQLNNQPEQIVINKTSFDVTVKIRKIVENSESPILTISFNIGGSFNQLKLKFPVSFIRTLSATNMVSLGDFKKRWLQIGEQLPGRQGEAITKCVSSYRCNSLNIVRLLSRLGFAVVHSTPDNTDAGILVMGAGILHSQQSNFGVLVTVRSTDDVGKEFEIIVRCTGGGVSDVIASTLQEILEGKF